MKIFLRSPGISGLYILGLSCFILACALSCSKKEPQQPQLPQKGPLPALLVAQAQFLYVTQDGKRIPTPGPAVLTIKQKTAEGWHTTILEDPQSNVFHKALFVPGKRQILTIGAMEAALKVWEYRDSGPVQRILWSPFFGGKWDRLRDLERDDVTGDGTAELIMATHDQGVIAVARQQGNLWSIKEIDRETGIFVHEIEVGDVDGDGIKEFFATPSQPNKAMGGPQPGKVIMYKWGGKGFSKRTVESSEATHAKEILACEMGGTKGVATLFAVFEAETRLQGDRLVRVSPVRIKQYYFDNGKISSNVIATLNDYQCRFLTAGDIDGDGHPELVAAAMKSGLWLIKPHGDGWRVSAIDADSSGYEHATCLADLDGDGKQEIYVAADDQHELRSYTWNGKSFDRKVIDTIPENRITWNITAGIF